MSTTRWARNQLLKVLSLYCQIPFGSMHHRNPMVVALAKEINRSPSAVALKLVNFASLDPDLRDRGVSGMSNVSRLDREIWTEFYGNWQALAENSTDTQYSVDESIKPHKQAAEFGPPSKLTEILELRKVRRYQSFFRASVLAAYCGRCCITGITSPPLLRASHIIPWAKNVDLRLDPRNGLCLNALHDAAFDRGLISLSNEYHLLGSPALQNHIPDLIYRQMFEAFIGRPIDFPERFRPVPEVLEYHRTNIFLND